MEQKGLRSIITDEVKQYVCKIAEGNIDLDILQFINSIDPNIIETLDKITRELSDRIRKDVLLQLQISIPPEIESVIHLAIRKSATTASLIGWLLEHLSRNNIELEKAPSLDKYISDIAEAEGNMEKLKESLVSQKPKKSKRNTGNFKAFMETLENYE